tara:strand:- start:43 stop:240 length:198 start_codon:yes stop_codon:yes gene_type:complete
MKIITNTNTLKAMISRGYIAEAKYGKFPQVDHNKNNDWRFGYNDKNYKLHYLSGSIFPFVFEEVE